MARWREDGRAYRKAFPVRRYLGDGIGFEEASQLAYDAAVAHRQSLEVSGMIRTRGRAEHQSGIKGVYWHGRRKAWEVRRRRLLYTRFKPKDNTPKEIENARALAVSHLRGWEGKAKHQSGDKGVKRHPKNKVWCTTFDKKGKGKRPYCGHPTKEMRTAVLQGRRQDKEESCQKTQEVAEKGARRKTKGQVRASVAQAEDI